MFAKSKQKHLGGVMLYYSALKSMPELSILSVNGEFIACFQCRLIADIAPRAQNLRCVTCRLLFVYSNVLLIVIKSWGEKKIKNGMMFKILHLKVTFDHEV